MLKDYMLEYDRVCLGCGYNLRGLSVEGECPECGMAVGSTLHREKIARSEGEWGEALCGAKGWVIAAAVFWMCMVQMEGGWGIVWPIKMLIMFKAVWSATVVKPSGFVDESMNRWGMRSRVFGVLAVMLLALWTLVIVVVEDEVVGKGGMCIFVIASGMFVYCFCEYGKRIAINLGLHRMMWHVSKVKWVGFAASVMLIGLATVAPVRVGGGGLATIGYQMMRWLGCAFGLFTMVAYIWCIVAAVIVGRELEDAFGVGERKRLARQFS